MWCQYSKRALKVNLEILGQKSKTKMTTMDPCLTLYYPKYEINPKVFLEEYFSQHVPFSMLKESTINMQRCFYKAFKSGLVSGKTLIDISLGPTIMHLISVCEFLDEISILKVNDASIKGLEMWKNKHPKAFDWTQTSKLFMELKQLSRSKLRIFLIKITNNFIITERIRITNTAWTRKCITPDTQPPILLNQFKGFNQESHSGKGKSSKMDPVKVQAIHDWIQPTSVKGLQKFLGFANFYRRFIANFSSVVKPLTDLTKKGADVTNWSSEAVEAFQELNRRFTSAPVLRQLDVSLPFQIEVDSSEIGAGAVLSQRESDGSLMKPCAFFSRKFLPAERNYDVRNRELLAMKWKFEEW
ncbi:unnamed protein product [Ranitomeya imitator]|uniref:Reverse transcriptase/retrotransposon-derived protein RNase H-like domain-containing protein n=1 Tax=Ranitomeya imitator TaxID=111125 RepID=A0ABN9KUE7_9NEOB|nr:unnamed protein product [Ranitomeya imitator]